MKSKCFPIIVGDEYESLRYGKFTVLSYSSASKVLIKFKETGCEMVVTSDLIRRKCIRDTSVELKTLIYGVGDRDIGISEDTNYAYDLWTNMLKRCYSDKHLSLTMYSELYKLLNKSEDFQPYIFGSGEY